MATASILLRGTAVVTALLAAGGAVSAGPGAPPIAYPTVMPDQSLSLNGRPRIGYPALPVDARIAPVDMALDDDIAEPPSPAEQAALTDRLALAQWSQNYRPSPAIWRIRDADTTIYLFGTIHVLPPGFQWRSAALERVVAQADTLLVESLGDEPALVPPRGARRLPPLARRVSADHRAKLTMFVQEVGPDAARVLDTMPTWMAAVAIGFTRESRAGEQPGPGADDWLENQFRSLGRPVTAIEDSSRVLAQVSAIPVAEQRRMLDAALDAAQPDRATLRAPLHAWARGQAGAGSPLVVDLAGSSGTAALARPLMDQRNRAWTASLIRRLATPGVVLFAAGAGHFTGAGSVLELLARRGIVVERME